MWWPKPQQEGPRGKGTQANLEYCAARGGKMLSYSNTQLAIFIKCPSLLHLMGVLLLLSQERRQKFVSFGFDHIISGFCYLIRQKFKLTSFSTACLEVSCTVWSGFWQFFNGRKKGKLCLESVGGRRGNHLPGPLGLHLLSRKDPRVKSSHQPWWGASSGTGRGSLGECQPWALEGLKRKGWRTSLVIYFCVQGPLTLHSWGQTC